MRNNKEAASRLQKTISLIIILSLLVGSYFVISSCYNLAERLLHPLKYTEIVEKYSLQYGVPKDVIYAVILTESKFEPDAVSYKGAVGLMQIMPETFLWLCGQSGESYDTDLMSDPDINIKFGTYFLSLLFTQYADWNTVYAAYNAGAGRVDEWLQNPAYSENDRLTDIPFGETEHYVVKVRRAAEIYRKLYT